jgi:ribosomal protein S18 acetylase RimI-like enzyme
MGQGGGLWIAGGGLPMLNISYFKRFRMEIELAQLPAPDALPPGFRWIGWDDSILGEHAAVKARCFADEIDAQVFPSLASLDGCLHLMREIRRKPGFLPAATWLLAHGETMCATVQGICERPGLGAIQNCGVVPAYRGRGLGRALLLKALYGFWRSGLGKAHLEVTADNYTAVRLYRRVGFRCRKTLYKAVESGVEVEVAGG